MINPGATIGVFGSGQLGRMFAIEARKMGYFVATFSPDSGSPTGQVSDSEIVSPYDDLEKVEEFVGSVDVVTFEFENIPSKTIEAASRLVRVHPKGEVLHTTQNRLREKTFLSENGFPIAEFERIKTIEDLYRAVEKIGFPCVLKTAGFGYDGKGQKRIESNSDVEDAFADVDSAECVAESFVDFEREVSVVCARDEAGNFAHYGVIENEHVDHILDVSFLPGDVSTGVQDDAIEIARGIAEKFEYVGTLCIEFFLTGGDELLVNEIAPRPHNSGHLTFSSACLTSQFEQQIRAICALPLGKTEFVKPVAMANLLGDLWENGEPGWSRALKDENVKLHLYGKAEPRRARKMGHLIAYGNTTEDARDSVIVARDAL